MDGYNEVDASNQRSTGKQPMKKVSSRGHHLRMPKITHTGKPAKNTKGPAKKIGKEK